jgi:hypothetical protein
MCNFKMQRMSDSFALTSICTLLMRHSCVYVKTASCECLLLLLLRFERQCDASTIAPRVFEAAVLLLRSGKARVITVALQLIDHLMGHSRSSNHQQRSLASITSLSAFAE